MANGLIERAVEAEINRRVRRGELMLPSMVEEDLEANLRCRRKMMMISVHRGLGIGKKRFKEKVYPELNWVENLYLEEKEKTDEVYAMSIIDRLYDEIMEGDDGY